MGNARALIIDPELNLYKLGIILNKLKTTVA